MSAMNGSMYGSAGGWTCSRCGKYGMSESEAYAHSCAGWLLDAGGCGGGGGGSDIDLHHMLAEILKEVVTARQKWPPMHSAHEAFAVLLEEVDELKAHVWTKQRNRDLEAMKREAIQVAAMALRFASEVCTEERGRT